MTFLKTMTFNLAFLALAGALTIGAQGCSKKTFTSVNTENVDPGTNAYSNGGGGTTNTNTNTGNNNGTGNGTGNNNGTTNGTGTNNGTNNGNTNNGTTNGTTNNGTTNGSTNNGTTNNGTTNGSTNNGTTNGTTNGTNPPVSQYCITEKYTQPSAVITKKLDLLIVTDTSSSMDDERAALANGIKDYLARLPSGTDVRIAVMLAHGPTSWFGGRLYKSDFKDPREKYVLSNQNMNTATLQKWMDRKLRYRQLNYSVRAFTNDSNISYMDPSKGALGLPTDYDAGGGEASFASMNEAMRNYAYNAIDCKDSGACRYKSIQNMDNPSDTANYIPGELGFFRPDAALATVFISDENDLCHPDTTMPYNQKEDTFYQTWCKNQGINAQSVLQLMQARRASLPIYISSIIYNTPGRVPVDALRENGIGYGYNTIAQISNGTIIDITNGAGVISNGLTNIAGYATQMLNLRHDFILKYKRVLSNTISAKVDGSTKAHAYSSTTNTVYLNDAGSANSKVNIRYCLEKDAPLDPYPIAVSSFLQTNHRATYIPDVVVETSK